MSDDFLVRIKPSPARRFIGLATLLSLGIMLLYLGLTLPVDFIGKILLIGFGAIAVWGTDAMRRATASAIVLQQDGVYDIDGTLIAKIDNIKATDRGMLAFKPSNGFMLTLKEPMPRAWRPGLWWRIGRRVGVGGVTSGHMTKAMSEVISTLMPRDPE